MAQPSITNQVWRKYSWFALHLIILSIACLSNLKEFLRKQIHDLLGFENLSTLLLTALFSLLLVLLLLELSSVSSDVRRTSSSSMSTIEFPPLERNILSGSLYIYVQTVAGTLLDISLSNWYQSQLGCQGNNTTPTLWLAHLINRFIFTGIGHHLSQTDKPHYSLDRSHVVLLMQ